MRLSIPIIMKVKLPGGGQRFFPSFFLLSLLLALAIGCYFFPPEAAAQPSEREGLSLYDRLAEEATLLNSRIQYDKVIALLEPRKEDKKNHSALFFNELGIAYRHKGRLSDSIQAYESALSRDPENPVVRKNLGDAFYLSKEYSRAIEQYQKALTSNPSFQQAHSSLGLAYYQLQKYKEALEHFEIVLKLDPQDEQVRKFREAIEKILRQRKSR